ncbi:MAG: acetyl-CoA hydrolase/transferase family protein [Verrucomicrobiales bacterium]|jgi:acetyl-CoA hydrolase|nr:acetyl-CoA hydrolase/transferase family protein [Verrucomicrobiales bacterium]
MSHGFKILSAEQAAELINNGETIGFSGFTPAGAAKAVPTAIAKKAEREHAAGRPFKIGVVTGASTGPSLDGALTKADAVSWRTPYQSNADLRKAVNGGAIRFFDMHLSMTPQAVNYGFLGKFQWAIVEAADLTADGEIVPSTSVGASPTFCHVADKIIVELNKHHPKTLRGFHDIYEPANPPHRLPIPIVKPSDRVGTPFIKVDPQKIIAVVETDLPDEIKGFDAPDAVTDQIGQNVADFLAAEVQAGRIPREFLPIQSGVGNIANAVLGSLGKHPGIPPFEMFTEVVQDAVIDLMKTGKVKFATGTSLTVSADKLQEIYADLEFFRTRLLLRPQEITNHPEMVRRLGIITVNTAIEADLFGNINSTHILGKNLMNGVGGSGDFTRNGYISIFTCPSVAKGGKITSIVPMVSHTDHNEHSVQVLITERGIADLRGKTPKERAALIIEKCAHPDYQAQLRGYLDKYLTQGHIPQSLEAALAMHRQFAATGDMRGVDWTKFGN